MPPFKRVAPPFLLVILILFTRNNKRVVKGGKRVVTERGKGGKVVYNTTTLSKYLLPLKGWHHPLSKEPVNRISVSCITSAN